MVLDLGTENKALLEDTVHIGWQESQWRSMIVLWIGEFLFHWIFERSGGRSRTRRCIRQLCASDCYAHVHPHHGAEVAPPVAVSSDIPVKI